MNIILVFVVYQYNIDCIDRMAAPSGKFKFRANAPPFVPINIQEARNRKRSQALRMAMIHDPTLISSLGLASKSQHPSYNPNIQAAYNYLKGPERIRNIIDTYIMIPYIMPFPPDVLAEIERILCKDVRIPSDDFAEIFNRLIKTGQVAVVRRLLKCDTLVRTAREKYTRAESFKYNASTLYHFLDDSMIDIAERLYEIGIDINYRSDSKPGMYTIGADTIPNYTPLEQAIINVQPELVKFFLSKGATPPTNPDSLFHAIIPIGYSNIQERIQLSKRDPEYIDKLKAKIEEIYTLVPSLKQTLNVLILTRDVPEYPIEKKTILTRLNEGLETSIIIHAPLYRQMINYFITKITTDGAIEGSEVEQRGGSRKRKQSRRHIKTKRSRRILTRRLK